MGSRNTTGAPALRAYSRDEWAMYFDAVAVGLVAMPYRAASSAQHGKALPLCGRGSGRAARVNSAIEAHVDMVGPNDPAKWH